MGRIKAAIVFILAICIAQSSPAAGPATVKNGYIACEDLSTLILAIKYVKEKKDLASADPRIQRCRRTENFSGLPVEIIGSKEGYSHLLLRAEKVGELNFEFWTESQALMQSKSTKSRK
jgi:hypothetical protein